MSRVLVVNAGSSSLKLSLLHGDRTDRAVSVDPAGARDALAELLGDTARPDAVGHRLVHGGPDFTGPTVVDDEVLARIDALGDLAPLHQRPAVAALEHQRAVVDILAPDVESEHRNRKAGAALDHLVGETHRHPLAARLTVEVGGGDTDRAHLRILAQPGFHCIAGHGARWVNNLIKLWITTPAGVWQAGNENPIAAPRT